MNNFTSMVVAMLEKLELLTEDEAKTLAKELHTATLPDNYEACAKLLTTIFKDKDIKAFHTKVPASTLNPKIKTVDTKL